MTSTPGQRRTAPAMLEHPARHGHGRGHRDNSVPASAIEAARRADSMGMKCGHSLQEWQSPYGNDRPTPLAFVLFRLSSSARASAHRQLGQPRSCNGPVVSHSTIQPMPETAMNPPWIPGGGDSQKHARRHEATLDNAPLSTAWLEWLPLGACASPASAQQGPGMAGFVNDQDLRP